MVEKCLHQEVIPCYVGREKEETRVPEENHLWPVLYTGVSHIQKMTWDETWIQDILVLTAVVTYKCLNHYITMPPKKFKATLKL